MSPVNSLSEAQKYRYGVWAGCPNGYPYNPKYCAEPIMTGGRGSLPAQCAQKPGSGRDGIFCNRHALQHPAEKQKIEKWFRCNAMFSPDPPQVVEVVRATKSMIFIRADSGCASPTIRQELRFSQYYRYFPTYKEALEFLLDRIDKEITKGNAVILGLKGAKAALEDLRSLEEPE